MPCSPNVTKALEAFDAARATGRLAQAYLVVGNVREEGIPFAEGVLGRLYCEGIIKPCGDCPSCVRLKGRRHTDVAWIEPEKKSRTVGIDRIRDLQRLVYQTAVSGNWKVVVLVGADRVGEEAANAFLKTLEEPPPRCLFLLLSDSPQAILPTILSRCQRLVLSTEQEVLPEPWRTQLLEVFSVPLEEGLVARLTRGMLLAQLLDQMKKSVKQAEDDRAEDEDVGDETVDARIEARFRGLRSMVVRAILFWYRDLFVMASGAGVDSLRYREQAEALRAKATGLSYRDALRNLQVVEGMQRQFDRNLMQDEVIHAAMNALTV